MSSFPLSARLRSIFLLLALPLTAPAETGYDAWLRYAPIQNSATKRSYDSLPATITVVGDSPVLSSAQAELIRGATAMLGRPFSRGAGLQNEAQILLGTFAQIKN